MFLNKLEKKIRIFFIIWIAFTAVIILIAALAYSGAFNSKITDVKIEEIKSNPQIVSQIQQWKQQGISKRQIKEQLLRGVPRQYLSDPIDNAIHIMKKASRNAAFITIISCFLFYFIFVNNKKNNQQKMLFAIALIGLLLIDQIYVAKKYIMEEPIELTLQKPAAIAKLQTVEKPFRVSVLDRNAYNIWLSSLFRLHGIECIDVPADSRPSALRKIFFYSNAISPVKRWQYSNVKYLLGPQQTLEMSLRQLGVRDDFSQFYSYDLNGQKHAIYEYKKMLPRVYAIGEWVVKTNAAEVASFMNLPSTDPHKTAVLLDDSISEQSLSNFSSKVKIDSYEPVEIKATVTLSAPGIVALVTEPTTGWKVKVDEKEQETFRCNLMHQGVMVPAGNHSVVFYYDPPELWIRKLQKWAYAALPVLLIFSILLVFLSRKKCEKR